MPTFALVAEGVTDQIILERMIEGVCGIAFPGEVFVNPLQPIRDATDEFTAPHGGWGLVLEYCERKISDALSANDYVVVHIDTDDGENPNFGLSLTDENGDRSFEALVDDAKDILVGRIGREIYNSYKDRFIFAISVHSMESWILLYMFDVDEVKNSFDRLNRRLIKGNKPPLVKEARCYRRVAQGIKKRKLMSLSAGSSSLAIFLNRLAELK